MKGIRLTKRTVDAQRYQGSGACYYWDSELSGFGLRVYPSGRRSFVVTYRVRGRQRFYTVGKYGEMTVKQARTAALATLARARKGEDPAAERQRFHRGPTMEDLARKYLKEHASIKKKSARIDAQTLERLVLPRLGKRKVADIDRSDLSKLHSELAETPGMANLTVSILSKMFSLAEVWGWRPEGANPCRHVQRFKLERRERFLSESELSRLGAVLSEAERSGGESPHSIAAIRLLILTGCRKMEILRLRWDYVDFERQCLHLPDSKTGKKTVVLNSAALQVLANLDRVDGSPFVIPGKSPDKPRFEIKRLWARICKAAELEEVRIHDLRHTFASVGVNAGLNLPIIGRLLGHTQVATTERYAHLADDPVRAANERIGDHMVAVMTGKSKAEVVAFNTDRTRRVS